MSVADLVYERVRALPEPLARQVLDFVAFLEQRDARGSERDLSAAQSMSLGRIWENPEDQIWDEL